MNKTNKWMDQSWHQNPTVEAPRCLSAPQKSLRPVKHMSILQKKCRHLKDKSTPQKMSTHQKKWSTSKNRPSKKSSTYQNKKRRRFKRVVVLSKKSALQKSCRHFKKNRPIKNTLLKCFKYSKILFIGDPDTISSNS